MDPQSLAPGRPLLAGRPLPDGGLDLVIARLVSVGTNVSIVLLAAGVVALALAGTSPYAPSPGLDPARLASDVLGLRPAGFLWLGLLAAMATPTARVVAALIGFWRRAERQMAAVSGAILGVIVLSVVLARLAEG